MNTAPLNAAPLNAAASTGGSAPPSYTTGKAFLPLHCRAATTGAASLALGLTAHGLGTVALPLVLTLGWQTGVAVGALRARRYAIGTPTGSLHLSAGITIVTGAATLPLRLRAYGTHPPANPPRAQLRCALIQPILVDPTPVVVPGSVGGITHDWAVVVQVGALTTPPLPVIGTVQVSVEENGARTASFTCLGLPEIAPGDPVSVVLKVDGAQTELFRGALQSLEFSPDQNECQLSASDELQHYADALSRAQIEAITPGALTVPGSKTEGYSYLTERLQTLPASAFIRKNGRFAVARWDEGVSPATAVTRTVYQTTHLSRKKTGEGDAATTDTLPSRKRTVLEVSVSWVRIAQASTEGLWISGIGLCDVLAGVQMPYTQAVIDAAKGAGWDIGALDLTLTNFASGFVTCGTATVGLLLADGYEQGVARAQWTLTKRYTRAMRGKFTVVIDAASAPADQPVEEVKQSVSFNDSRDGNDWVAQGAGEQYLIGVDANGDRYGDLIDLGSPTDVDGVGTAYADARNAGADVAAQVAYQLGKRAADAARLGRDETLITQTIIRPDLDIGDWLTIQHPTVQRTGMVSALQHVLDIDSGTALTTVTVTPFTAHTTTATPGTTTMADWAQQHLPSDAYFVAPTGSGSSSSTTATEAANNALGSFKLNQILTRKKEPKLSPPNTYIGGIRDMLVPESDQWQGWVVNKPSTTVTQGITPPAPLPAYANPGFFIRVPALALPDQTEDIDLGTFTLLI